MTRTITRALALSFSLVACSDSDPVLGPGRPVVRVEVNAPEQEVWLGRAVAMTATAFDEIGPVSRSISWSSSDTTIATVDSSGTVITRSTGTVRIRATADGVTGERALTVYTWDLMFFSLGGTTFAETMVLPPNSGGFPERLFPIGRNAGDAVPSPDALRIAYAVRDAEGYTDLWIANRDGSGARLLAHTDGNDEWPSWSPDGTRIAFQSDVAGHSDIYVVNVDGTGMTRLSNDPLPATVQDLHPAWSPDGARIAYSTNLHGYYAIYTMRPDGSDVRRISVGTASDLEPAWSPSGARLAVRRVTQDNEWDIWTMNNDGSGATRLPLPGWQRAPSWRGDGSSIAFSSRVGAASEPWQVWTMAFTGADAVQQTPHSFTGGHRPVWLRRR